MRNAHFRKWPWLLLLCLHVQFIGEAQASYSPTDSRFLDHQARRTRSIGTLKRGGGPAIPSVQFITIQGLGNSTLHHPLQHVQIHQQNASLSNGNNSASIQTNNVTRNGTFTKTGPKSTYLYATNSAPSPSVQQPAISDGPYAASPDSHPIIALESPPTHPPAFIQANDTLDIQPSKNTSTTPEITFGYPTANAKEHANNTGQPPLPTEPPAPPLRPDGLDSTGLKVVQVVNKVWTTNTSITTVSPGGTQPTVVPVILKAAGVGLVLFGLSAAQEVIAPIAEIGEAAEVAEEEVAGEEPGEEEEEEEEPESISSGQTSTDMPRSSSTASTTMVTTSSSTLFSSSSGTSSRASSTTLSSATSTPSPTSTTSTSTSGSSSSSSSSATVSIEACSNPTDYPHFEDQDDVEDDGASGNAKIKRFASGGSSNARRQLEQMGTYTNMKKPLSRLGSCRLDETTDLPPFWKANSVIGKRGNSPYWYMPVPEDPNKLDAFPTFTAASTGALRTLSPTRKSVIIGGSNGYRTNVDHVYEVSILKKFFNYYLAQKGVCQRFNTDFMSKSSKADTATRLAVVFAQLPGVQFGGLAGMDQRLNSIKAYFFQAGEIQRGLAYHSNGLCDSIRNLQLAGVVMDTLHSAELRKFFNDANSRIYQALLGADNAIAADKSKGCSPSPEPYFSWADEYKSWIDWFLRERELEIQNWARETQRTIINDLKQRVTKTYYEESGSQETVLDPTYDDDRKRINAFIASPYGQASHWTFSFNLQYSDNALPMDKRDTADSCTKTSTTNQATGKVPSPTTRSTHAAIATPSSGVSQQQKTPMPAGDVSFIENGGRERTKPPTEDQLKNDSSANQLNNDNSANQFNNAIQRIATPA